MTVKVPKNMQKKFDEIVAEIKPFCDDYLNDKYYQVCQEMTGKLARKRPSPLERSGVNTWAAGIIYAVGQVNFLFDSSEEPYASADDIAGHFGIAKSTAGNKAKTIRDLLKISMMDADWTLPSRLDRNPMAWMIQVNGYILDARYLTREVQELAYKKGLIPYIPADRNAEE